MENYRPRNNIRYLCSFLLALVLHVVIFLLGHGSWGQPTDNTSIRLVYSRVVEVKNPPAEQKIPQKQVPEKKPAKVEKPKEEVKPPEPPPQQKVEKKAQTTEVVQEKPSEKKTVPPEGEKNIEEPPEKEMKTEPEQKPQEEVTDTENVLDEETEPSEGEKDVPDEKPSSPPLPPLGNGFQMVGIHRTFYPKDLQNKGIEGSVVLEIYVNEEGTLLRDPVVKTTSGHPELDRHCIRTVKEIWRFKPAPRPYKLVVELTFTQDQVKEPRFLEEADYLSPEEGGTSE